MENRIESLNDDGIMLNIPIELDAILNSMSYYVLLVDDTHHILYANAAVQSRFGLDPKQLVGGYCPNVIHGMDRPIPECPLEESVITNSAVEREIFDEENDLWLSSAIYPTELLTLTGSKVYLHTVRDITSEKSALLELKNSLLKFQKLTEASIKAITLIVEKRDPYTAGHQQRVSKLACAIAYEMGYDELFVHGIRIAGLLHDVGKIGIPIEILIKPGSISEDEFRLIKAHPNICYDILKDIEFTRPIADIVLQHHERLDGSGYPNGLKGDAISIDARIISVADVVEAMVSHRPYRPALGLNKALTEIIKNKGILYDEVVVDTCVRLFVDKNFEF